MLLSGIMNTWAEDVTYSPTLDVNFRTASGNTAWQVVKNAADEGNNDFELCYANGFFALQKYTVANLQNASKLVITLTVGKYSGVDAVKMWPIANNTWTAETGVDDIVGLLETTVGIAPRATEGDANTPPIAGAKVASSSPAKATFTISGSALAAIKANATEDGTFTLLLTNNDLMNTNNKRSYLSINSANAEANRPSLVATIETPSVVNKTTGVGYSSLTEAFNAAVATGTDAELEVSEDQTLTGRLTWNKAATLTITPKADITIKGHTNQMWFLSNVDNANLIIGGDDYTITFDGDNKAMGAYPITKREKKSNITLKNVKFQNFDLNSNSALCQGANADGVMTLENITVSNCKNPAKGFFYNERVVNDKIVLKGYLNIDSDCEGTDICATAEYKSNTQVNGRIKVGSDTFTATNVITIDWLTNNAEKNVFVEGISVVVGVKSSFANLFKLTNEEWTLELKGSDLKLAKPAVPTAKIGDQNYADLAAALAAVQDGETITLLADQEISSRVNIKNKSITIDGQSQYAIKRATGYTNGMLFLTQTADEGYTSSLTLDGLTIDGQNVEATAAVMEVSNYSPMTLNQVTFKNCVNTSNPESHQGVIINNKAGGTLNINGVTFTNCSVASGQALIFAGTNNVTLKGTNTIPSIYLSGKNVLNADHATTTAPILIITDNTRTYGLLVSDGDATQFASESFRLSQQQDGVYAMPLAIANAYAHPTLLHTAADIEAVKTNLSSNDALFNAAYQRLEAQSGGAAAGAVEYLKRMDQTNWEATYPDYNNYTRAANDAKLAYELALRYQLKGSTAAATAAVNILNDWATNNKGILRLKGYNNNIPDPNEYLICIQAYQFANAAELLRDYTGWQGTDFQKFQNWIRQTFADVAILFLQNHHNNANPLHYWLNWDLAALNAMMSVGILCDDKSLVDFAIDYVSNGEGTGNKANAIVATHDDTDSEETLAQCQESGRDQGHSTLDVTLLGALCQTAQNSGVNTDLWTTYKALEMAEYVGKYNLKNADQTTFVYDNVPFSEYTNGEVTHTAISADARGTERNCWELIYAYAKNNDKAAAYVQKWVEYLRTKYAYGEGEATTNDELGFGTLMFAAPNDLPTGITTIQTNGNGTSEKAEVYDLQGRRVSTMNKGIYIINGKKVVK